MSSIAEWLETVQLAQYAARFAEHEITLDVLPHLTEADIDRLGLPIGPRRRLVVAVHELAAARGVRDVERADTGAGGAERRQLTVMFCDLAGSTALTQQLDPEELRELMRTYRTACSDVVARYDGHVAQYLGDGLMVYFGWPRAHEDDAERGVRAALEMVRAVRELRAARPLAVRIGLATGPVVVGDDSRHDTAEVRLAVGETPNLAARLEGLAGLHEVVIAPTTRHLVVGAFALTDLGEHRLKGIAQPVRAWRVDAASPTTAGRFQAGHGGKAPAPFVGREDESALLMRRWREARGGAGQVVLIGGQAGIGKSRLAEGLHERIAEPHTVLHYQSSPYHLNSPLHPFIEQLEFAAGFARDDAPDQRLEKLEGLLGGGAAQIAESLPLLAALLSLPTERYPPLRLSPQKQKEKTLEALAGLVEAQAGQGSVLMVVEDLHWLDPTSQELLEILVPMLRGLPVLLVMTYRLEDVPMWAGQAGVTTLILSRLGRHEGAQLLDAVTGGRAMPPEVRDEILARTDGVPLFVEELTRSVIESGLLREEADHYVLQGPLTELSIPASLRDSLMARLDRLGSVKELAQIGACIGREFSSELLERLTTLGGESLQASLDRLVSAGLVTRRDTTPDATYTFKHALVQDAAYDSLLKSRRSELHARIAHVLETEFADRVANKPESLAHHHTQAGHLAAAIPLWRKAGMLAVARVALQEAVAYFGHGLALIDQLPPSEERDRLELTIREPLNAASTGLYGWAASQVAENAAAVLRLAESQGNAQSRLLAMWWVWTNTITQGRIADSLPWVQRLLAEGSKADDIDLRIFGHATAMVQHFLGGQLLESREQADRALALYDPARAEAWIQVTGHDLRTFVEVYACQLLWILGFPDQARQLSEASTARTHPEGHTFSLAWALIFSAYVYAYRREPERLLARIGETDRIAREQGLTFIYQVSVPQAHGLAELQSGRPGEAITLLRDGIERWTKLGGHVRIPYLKSALAEAVALQGDLDTAVELIDECLEQIERPAWQERVWLPEVLRLKGWMLRRQGRTEEAEAQLRASLDCARQLHAKSWELRSATTLATLMISHGRRDEARELLAPVCGWFTEGRDTKDLIEATALLAELSS